MRGRSIEPDSMATQVDATLVDSVAQQGGSANRQSDCRRRCRRMPLMSGLWRREPHGPSKLIELVEITALEASPVSKLG
jgi:hypothetical protein